MDLNGVQTEDILQNLYLHHLTGTWLGCKSKIAKMGKYLQLFFPGVLKNNGYKEIAIFGQYISLYLRNGKVSGFTGIQRLSVVPHTRGAQVWTCFYPVSVHHTAPSLTCNGVHLLAAYYSFMNTERMKG